MRLVGAPIELEVGNRDEPVADNLLCKDFEGLMGDTVSRGVWDPLLVPTRAAGRISLDERLAIEDAVGAATEEDAIGTPLRDGGTICVEACRAEISCGLSRRFASNRADIGASR